MTPTRRRECLALLRWTQRGFAAVIGWDEGTVRRWLRDGGKAPAEIDAWLERRAMAMADDLPPSRHTPISLDVAQAIVRSGAPLWLFGEPKEQENSDV